MLPALLDHARTRTIDLGAHAERPRPAGGLRAALAGRERLSVVAEVKRRAPSAGELDPELDAVHQAGLYARAGASAVSVLTEPSRFGGSYEDLGRVRDACELPLLMKDFIVDARAIAMAEHLGAAAVLLLVRALDDAQLADLLAEARGRGLDALVEVHDEPELERALAAEADLIGINNRDLSSLRVDRTVVQRLAPLVPREVVLVAESGYATPEELAPVRGQADAALIGSALVRAPQPEALLRELLR